MSVSANRLEILQIADAVAREKSIDRMIVIAAMEDAMQKAARQRYGQELDIRAQIDPKSGEMTLWRCQHVAETPVEPFEISLKDARFLKSDAAIGDVLKEELPPMDFGRVAAQTAKQVIMQRVREAERDQQFDAYKDRVGEIVNGIVKREEHDHVIMDLGQSEAIMRREQRIPRETLRVGDRVRAYIYDVRREARGPQVFVSRAHPQFMAKLFAQQVPEVYDNVIEIRSVARDPGSRAKIAVISNDNSIDPVGACVGMRGSRVQAVVAELAGEKIDIVPWSPNPATFIVNALQPAEVSKVVLDEDENRVEVIVPESQSPLAIGRKGQNVRLAAQLTGWQIDIITEEKESERRQKEFAERTALFMDALDLDETVAQLLATEAYSTIEEIAYVEPENLLDIEGFSEDLVAELQERAVAHLAVEREKHNVERQALGVADDLFEFDALPAAQVVALGKQGIKTLEDFAGLIPEDLTGAEERRRGDKAKGEKRFEVVKTPGLLDGFDIKTEAANILIMRARLALGWVDQAALDALLPAPEELTLADEVFGIAGEEEEPEGEEYIADTEGLVIDGEEAPAAAEDIDDDGGR